LEVAAVAALTISEMSAAVEAVWSAAVVELVRAGALELSLEL
jgi:hypothetical protein